MDAITVFGQGLSRQVKPAAPRRETICTDEAAMGTVSLHFIGAIDARRYAYRPLFKAKDIYIVDSITAETLHVIHNEHCEIAQAKLDSKREHLIVTGTDPSAQESVYWLCITELKTYTTTYAQADRFVGGSVFIHNSDDRYLYFTGIALDKQDKRVLISTLYRFDLQTCHTEARIIYRNRTITGLALSNDGAYLYVLGGMSMEVVAADSLVVVNRIWWPCYKLVFNLYAKTCVHADILITSCTDNTIRAFDIKHNRDILNLNMLDVITFEHGSNQETIAAQASGITAQVYISRDLRYVCLLYTVSTRGLAYATLLEIQSARRVAEIASDQHHWLPGSFTSQLRRYKFDERDRFELEHRYRALVFSAHTDTLEGSRIAYCRERSSLAVCGRDANYRRMMYRIDLNRISLRKPIDLENVYTAYPSFHNGQVRVQVENIQQPSEMLAFEQETDALLSREPYPGERDNGLNWRYRAEIQDGGETVRISDWQGNRVAEIRNQRGSPFIAYHWPVNPNALYTETADQRVERWEIDRLQQAGYAPLSYDISHLNKPKLFHVFCESNDGRYLINRDARTLYDTVEKRDVCMLSIDTEMEWPLIVDPELRFIIRSQYRSILHFFMPGSDQAIASLRLLPHGRMVFRTSGDSVARHGWIATNCAYVLNMYEKGTDGTVRLLNPGDKARDAYLQQYNRWDMVRNAILHPSRYHANVSRLALLQQGERMRTLAGRKVLLLGNPSAGEPANTQAEPLHGLEEAAGNQL